MKKKNVFRKWSQGMTISSRRRWRWRLSTSIRELKGRNHHERSSLSTSICKIMNPIWCCSKYGTVFSPKQSATWMNMMREHATKQSFALGMKFCLCAGNYSKLLSFETAPKLPLIHPLSFLIYSTMFSQALAWKRAMCRKLQQAVIAEKQPLNSLAPFS